MAHPAVASTWCPCPRPAVKGLRVWGNPFWSRFSKGIVDWLAINTVLWLALVAQITDFFSGVKVGGNLLWEVFMCLRRNRRRDNRVSNLGAWDC